MIGIIGGYGNIGQWAAKALLEETKERVRIGGREKEKFEAYKKKFPFSNMEYKFVDFTDLGSVETFAKGCQLILNCAGPTYKRASYVAEQILGMGILYVDVGYDSAMNKIFERFGRRNLLSKAGSIPGLSGVLPRYLARNFDTVDEADIYYTALGKFTKTASEDYLNGILRSSDVGVTTRKEPERKLLPVSLHEVYLYPYFDAECDDARQAIKGKCCNWFMALEGDCTKEFMLNAAKLYAKSKEDAVHELCSATYADTLGKKEYSGFVIQMSGTLEGKRKIKTLIMKAPSPEYLTGIAAAAAVIVTIQKKGMNGGEELGMIEDVSGYIDVLSKIGKEVDITMKEQTIEELTIMEEGEI